MAIAYCMVLPLRTLASSNGCKTRQSDWCDHCQDMNTSHSSFIRLHWLPIKFRINFKIAMLCFKCIHGHARSYLKSMIAIKKTSTYNCRSSTSIQLEDHFRDDRKKNAWRSSSLFQCIRQDLEQSPAIITVTAKF